MTRPREEAKQVFRNLQLQCLSHNHPSWLWRGATVFNQPSADTQLLITDAQAAPRATISDNFLGSCRSSRPRYASRRRAAPIQHDPAPATRASPGLGHAHVAGALSRRADSPTSTRGIKLTRHAGPPGARLPRLLRDMRRHRKQQQGRPRARAVAGSGNNQWGEMRHVCDLVHPWRGAIGRRARAPRRCRSSSPAS